MKWYCCYDEKLASKESVQQQKMSNKSKKIQARESAKKQNDFSKDFPWAPDKFSTY